MKLIRADVQNFRLLSDVCMCLDFEHTSTILVGPNNSGKTSMAEAFQFFFAGSKPFSQSDFSLACRREFNKYQAWFFPAVPVPTDPPLELDDADAEAMSEVGPGADAETANLDEPIAGEPPVTPPRLPHMSMTLHFDYADTPADLSLAGDLIMDLDPASHRIAIQIEFAVQDVKKLEKDYLGEREPDESLFEFLGSRLNDYYALSFFKVAADGSARERLADRTSLDKMLKIDFISAQRHIDDQEKNSQATRLSSLLHTHYQRRYKTDQPSDFKELEKALRDQSLDLSERYMKAFEGLIAGLAFFGYPQKRTPKLSIRAELNAGRLFKDNTFVYYTADIEAEGDDPALTHDLPEKYNGLGFKNLIYMILQIKTFREEFALSSGERPRVHLVVIEEPEVHLHPQVQSVFIKEIGKFLKAEGTGDDVQLIITTHSAHIVADSGFSPVRYFKKKGLKAEIKDLLSFEKTPKSVEEQTAIKFLARYLTVTRCDIFFADKIILIEGQVERLLLPKMIERIAVGKHADFASDYIAVIEVGGAYAHTFKSLVEFIEVPTLVITDLDAIAADRTKCRVAVGKSTSNATLKKWLPKKSVLGDLLTATSQDKTTGSVQVAYQVPDETHLPCGRSFEETFIYCNAAWLIDNKDKMIGTGSLIEVADSTELIATAYELKVDKVDFALDLMVTEGWKTPKYIADGLVWLAEQGGA